MKTNKYISIDSVLTRFQVSANYLKQFIDNPDFSFTAGSGLSELSDAFPSELIIPYHDIPGIPVSSVSGHSGELRLLRYNDKSCLYFAGRVHLYEGYSLEDTLFNVAISHLLGCKEILISNAVGGLNPNYRAGEIMLAQDRLNLLRCDVIDKSAGRTLKATHLSSFKELLEQSSIRFHTGCLMAVTGPNYETPAEIRAYRKLGADAVGMSTVLELKAAEMLGHSAIGISLISNELREVNTAALDHSHVVAAAKAAESTLIRILKAKFADSMNLQI